MQIIQKYFPTLSPEQREQYAALNDLYHDWNAKINVISRKDIDNLYEHHVLHSLAIAKVINIRPGTEVLDLGTGGGFPGIPLAIMFPDTHFHLLDSVGKKIRVCNEVTAALGLKNVTTQQARVEEVKLPRKADFVVSRAVMPLADLVKMSQRHISKASNNALPNGLIALKGGELERERAAVRRETLITPISDFFQEEYFAEKYVVYVQI
ncbi:MAG: 16S rRNA (guanine(527)-N(7))-methyltransferase RsmG [Bacteroidaceae bacterium]|nr:16S rRNA (guanine(527)-N(7))-methyltransferase RsmG [Bacteroidaceae bacterium]